MRATRVLLAAAVLAALLAVPASGVAGSSSHRSAYAGLGTWLDIYATSFWTHPQREVAAMARVGARTLYLQTGNYEQHVNLVRPQKLGRFIDAAHAAGMRVVAWYLPSFLYPSQDTRRALAAIRFQEDGKAGHLQAGGINARRGHDLFEVGEGGRLGPGQATGRQR